MLSGDYSSDRIEVLLKQPFVLKQDPGPPDRRYIAPGCKRRRGGLNGSVRRRFVGEHDNPGGFAGGRIGDRDAPAASRRTLTIDVVADGISRGIRVRIRLRHPGSQVQDMGWRVPLLRKQEVHGERRHYDEYAHCGGKLPRRQIHRCGRHRPVSLGVGPKPADDGHHRRCDHEHQCEEMKKMDLAIAAEVPGRNGLYFIVEGEIDDIKQHGASDQAGFGCRRRGFRCQ